MTFSYFVRPIVSQTGEIEAGSGEKGAKRLQVMHKEEGLFRSEKTPPLFFNNVRYFNLPSAAFQSMFLKKAVI
jgi:hypothetical protein